MSHYIGAYWGARSESATECACRLAECLQRLGQAHSSLARWYPKGQTLREAQSGQRIPTDVASLTRLVESGVRRNDYGGVDEDLGYGVSLWNGNEKTPSDFSATVGLYGQVPGLSNAFVLRLPPPSEDTAQLYTADTGETIFRAIVDVWQPDWATWTSHKLRAGQDLEEDGPPIVGWRTYLRHSLHSANKIIGLPQTVAVQEDSDGKTLVFQRGPLEVSAQDPLDVRNALRHA